MEHSEHYSQYLHAFSCAMLGQGASVFSPDGDAKPYLAVALGVVAARRDSDFLNLEEFCEAMATNLRITPKVDAAPVCPVDAPPPRTWEEQAADMGLTIRRPSDHQVQFVQDDRVLANWWPSKGTTLRASVHHHRDGDRGPWCRTGEDVIAWLKTI